VVNVAVRLLAQFANDAQLSNGQKTGSWNWAKRLRQPSGIVAGAHLSQSGGGRVEQLMPGAVSNKRGGRLLSAQGVSYLVAENPKGGGEQSGVFVVTGCEFSGTHKLSRGGHGVCQARSMNAVW
jgi:hypothetical protein